MLNNQSMPSLRACLWQAWQSHSAENRDCFGRNYEKILAMTIFQENVMQFTDYLQIML